MSALSQFTGVTQSIMCCGELGELVLGQDILQRGTILRYCLPGSSADRTKSRAIATLAHTFQDQHSKCYECRVER